MRIYAVSGCCAVNEIANLASYEEEADEAMRDFCRLLWLNKAQVSHRHVSPYGIYIFTAHVGFKEDEPGEITMPQYGKAFASFILKEKLGQIVESPPAFNHVNHPDHKVVLWTWIPDVRRLRAWAKKNAFSEGRPKG